MNLINIAKGVWAGIVGFFTFLGYMIKKAVNDPKESGTLLKLCGGFFACQFLYALLSILISVPLLSLFFSLASLVIAPTLALIAVLNMIRRPIQEGYKQPILIALAIDAGMLILALSATTLLLYNIGLIPFDYLSWPGIAGVIGYPLVVGLLVFLAFQLPALSEQYKNDADKKLADNVTKTGASAESVLDSTLIKTKGNPSSNTSEDSKAATRTTDQTNAEESTLTSGGYPTG